MTQNAQVSVHPLHIIAKQKLSQLNQAFTNTEEKFQEYKNARNQVIAGKEKYFSKQKQLYSSLNEDHEGHTNNEYHENNEDANESLNFGKKGFVYISSANIFLKVDSDYATELLDRCLVDLNDEKTKVRNEIESVLLDLRKYQSPS